MVEEQNVVGGNGGERGRVVCDRLPGVFSYLCETMPCEHL